MEMSNLLFLLVILFFANNLGTCLTQVNVPADLKKCPYPPTSSIAPCNCKMDSHHNAYLFCKTLHQKLLNDLATSFQCRKKIYRLEINMMGDELDYGFSMENMGSLEIEYLHIYNVSKVTADIEANAFKGSSNTLKEVKIQRLSGMEKSGRTIRAEAFSNLVVLKNVHLGDDFQILQSKSFSGLPSVVNLKLDGVKTIESKALFDMANLKKLDLTQSPVETINTEAFYNLPVLTTINFNAGTITTLKTKAFAGLQSIEKLDIGYNKLQQISSNTFYNLPEITLVNLNKNVITDLLNNIFNRVPKLAIIDLSHNSISSLPSNAFENLPSLTKLYLNNNKIASIHNSAMTSLPKLEFLDLSDNKIQEMGKSLENIKNKDLIINLNETKIQFLMEQSFKSFVDNIVNQRGTGYIDLGSLVLECGCEIKWLFKEQQNSGLTKFHHAVCEEGHTLEEVDAILLKGACPLEGCPGMLPGIDGGWSTYGTCSKSCGGGTHERSCNNPAPAFGGKSCNGPITASCNSQPCSLYLQREEKILKRGNLITSLQKRGKEYIVSFDFIATSLHGSANIIHLTTLNENKWVNGGSVPGVWIESTKELYIEASLNQSMIYKYGSIVPTNKWINIQLSQKLENGKYMFTAVMDGEELYRRENTKPQEFTNVMVYTSSPWHAALQGSIRNFFLQEL